jgi:AraC-like DNA-binding protein
LHDRDAEVSAAEFMLRSIGFALLASIAFILLRARSRDLKIQSGAWLAASVAAFMLTSMPDAEGFLGLLIYPLTALCSTHPVWFWLFSMALFSDGAKLRRSHLLCLTAMALGGVVYQFALPVDGREAGVGVRALGLGFSASALAFAWLAPLTVFLGYPGDLDSRRRRIRRYFVPGVSAYLAIVVITQCVVLFTGGSTPRPLVFLNIVVIDLAALLALSTFLRLRVVNWLEVVESGPTIALTRLEQSVVERIDKRFAPERLYARESLTITELATVLGTQEHVLRRVINYGLGFRNFSDFLHSHRLTEASQRLRDPAARRIPVLTIALEAGYGSIGPFNRAFKERFGMTPTEYRRAPDSACEPAAEPLAGPRTAGG